MALKRRSVLLEQQIPWQSQLQQMLQQRNMAQGGLIGTGVKIGFSISSPLSYKKLEQVLDVTIPTLVSTKVDTTVHGTTRFMRSIGGMQQVTDCSIKLLRDAYAATSPNQNLLFGFLGSQAQLYWRLEIPADPNLLTALFEAYEWQGRLMDIKPSAAITARQEYVATVGFDATFFNQFPPAASVLG